jgi:hypothetical protein
MTTYNDERLDVLSLDDRIWAIVHCGLTAREARLFAAWCAARALRRAGITDAASWAAVRVAARFAVGRATAEDLAAARDAAWAVDWAAAGVDAGSAARDDARDAAWDAAWFAARSAARSVSGVDADIAGCAGRAERAAQLARLRVVLSCGG